MPLHKDLMAQAMGGGKDSLAMAQTLLDRLQNESECLNDLIPDALHMVRLLLEMDVAFVAEFTGGQRLFRYVDAGPPVPEITIGGGDPLEESYCQRVVDGRLPEVIPDTLANPVARALAVTRTLSLRAYLSVPIRLSDGHVYGTFCCYSSAGADPTLGKRDLMLMRAFGDFIAKQIDRRLLAEGHYREMHKRISELLRSQAFRSVYQPIFDVGALRVVGFESLTRFDALPPRTPDSWFREAREVGLGENLEMAAVEKALVALDQLPADIYLSLNVSPESILSGAVTRVLEGLPLKRILLEVTEHHAVADYALFASMLAPLRRDGLRLAVDDAGAGYASFRHILQLEPDLIKLDIDLIRNIDKDTKRRALAAALIGFSRETGAGIVAEGVETWAELETLQGMEIGRVQGNLLGKGAPLEMALALL